MGVLGWVLNFWGIKKVNYVPQRFLYFLPEPQGQGSLWPGVGLLGQARSMALSS